jgi:hypothetical protein
MDDRMLVDAIHGSHDAILEFLFGCNADVAQDGARKTGLPSRSIRTAPALSVFK